MKSHLFFNRYIFFLKHKYSLHALRRLTADFDERLEGELCLLHVQMFVEAGALAPLRHDSQLRGLDAAHEQQDVHVSGEEVCYMLHIHLYKE